MSLKNVNGWMVSDYDKMITKKLGSVDKNGDAIYEKKFRDTLIKNVKQKKVFVDVGANIGLWTRPMALAFEKVIAIEPAERNLTALRYNVAGMNNIELIEKGVGDEMIENAQFHNTIKNCGGIKLAEVSTRKSKQLKDTDFTADIITIDSLQLEECDLIKIDVEGYELKVLKGAEETLKKHKPWIFVEKNDDEEVGVSHQKVHDFVMSLGIYDINDTDTRNAIYYPKTKTVIGNRRDLSNFI